jgi:hypothetical protein
MLSRCSYMVTIMDINILLRENLIHLNKIWPRKWDQYQVTGACPNFKETKYKKSTKSQLVNIKT